MKSSARPIINALRFQRGFAAQSKHAVQESGALPKQAPRISRLPNGAVVASLENYSPVSKVAIVYNAGSKVEGGNNAGITHCLRNAANQSTAKKSAFTISRSMEQLGGTLSCATSRDHVFYQMEVLRDSLSEGFSNLTSVATNGLFQAWALRDNTSYTHLDLAVFNQAPEAQMVEALHKAAYRTGLGNSLYMGEHLVGSHDVDMLSSFVNTHYTTSNMAVVGLGVDHDVLVKLVKAIATGSGQAPTVAHSIYHGGEMRISTRSPLVHAAMVMEGVGLGSGDLLALGVLQHIMGTGPSIKYSSHLVASKVNKAIAGVASGPFAASCINMNYAESGLFGVHAVALKDEIGEVLKSLIGVFNSVTKDGITSADIKRGKAQLMAAIHMSSESQSAVLGDLAAQVLLSGQILQPTDLDAAINKITLADVQAVAKKVLGGKPSMAAVGDLGSTPYLDEILPTK